MIEKDPISDQHIIECLKSDYGLEVTQLKQIPLGADIDASVYKAQTHDKTAYFVKLKRGHHTEIGTTIQLLLHNAGIQHIISPIASRVGNPTLHIDEYTLIVYPFIEGHDGFSQDLTNDQWITLGRTLKQIHTFQLPPSIKSQIRQESYSSQWRSAVRSIYTALDAGHKPTDVIGIQLAAFMKEQRDVIMHLVDRAEKLAHTIQQQSPEFVLCHSDIHAGNVLLAKSGDLFIVDWDSPIMAPKERDLMFIGGGVANVWNKPHEEESFYRGYGKTEINREILAYYRFERIIEDIAEYSEQLILSADGGEDRHVMHTHFMDMFEPRGVVVIALETDTGL